MFAELLIWKTSGECYELKEGYGAIQRKRYYLIPINMCMYWLNKFTCTCTVVAS